MENEAEIGRRRVRKGTRSCWECRRRKIKCQYDSSSEIVCLPCQARGSQCQSQEYVDESKTLLPDRRLAQRLGRLEELMEKLMDHVKPDTSTPCSSSSLPCADASSPSLHDSQDLSVDVLDSPINEDAPVSILLGLHNAAPTSQSSKGSAPDSEPASRNLPAKARCHKYDKICKALYALFPSNSDIGAIVKNNSGASMVTTMFYCRQEIKAGNSEPLSSLFIVPPITAHPTVLARRLLQLCVCMQHLSPRFNKTDLGLKTSLSQTMATIVSTVTNLVTSNDEVIASSEGLQSLVLLATWHSNSGNLRTAWLSNRRALNLAQLMGIDGNNSRALKSVDMLTSPRQHASAAGVWYRIVHSDRFISLLLGLPLGTWDNSFATEESMSRDEPQERLAKTHTVITARIIERNSNKTPQAYTMTQEIDYELETAANSLSPEWWREPILDPFAPRETTVEAVFTSIYQIHHFDLVILLHFPHMLRDPAESRSKYSRITCIRASREVLKRFIGFRTIVDSAYSCRHIDYSAVMAAMTLLLSYLCRPNEDLAESLPDNNALSFPLGSLPHNPDAQAMGNIHEDKRLIESVLERMSHIAIINGDKLSQKSADSVSELLPILASLDKPHESAVLDSMFLNVPYLGSVSIQPNAPTAGQALATNTIHTDMSDWGNIAPYRISIPTGIDTTSDPLFPGEPMDFSTMDHDFMGEYDGSGGMALPQFDPQLLPDETYPELTAKADDWVL